MFYVINMDDWTVVESFETSAAAWAFAELRPDYAYVVVRDDD